MKFDTLDELTGYLADSVSSLIKPLEREGGEDGIEVVIDQGVSSLSCSRYINISIQKEDEPGADELILRFSDHNGRGESTYRVDTNCDEIYDEFGEFSHLVISDHAIAEIIASATVEARDFIDRSISYYSEYN